MKITLDLDIFSAEEFCFEKKYPTKNEMIREPNIEIISVFDNIDCKLKSNIFEINPVNGYKKSTDRFRKKDRKPERGDFRNK